MNIEIDFFCLDKKKVDYHTGITGWYLQNLTWCITNVTSISTTPTQYSEKKIEIRENSNRLLSSNMPFKLVYYAIDGKL